MTRSASDRSDPIRVAGLLASLVIVMSAVLLERIVPTRLAVLVACFSAATTVVLARHLYGKREWYLLFLCAALVAVAFRIHPQPLALIEAGAEQAAFLMAFVLLLGLINHAASRSPSVQQVGVYLALQPTSRRFLSLYLGTGTMSVLFNLGIVSFLTPLIQKGVQSEGSPLDVRARNERRQLSAMMRGFAWSVIWSPTAMAPLAMMEILPGIDRRLWIGLGFVIFIAFLFVGMLEDRLRFRAVQPPSEPVIDSPFPRSGSLRLLMSCMWLFGLSGLISWLNDESIVFGLMAASPIMLAGWIYVQRRAEGSRPLDETGRVLRHVLIVQVPRSAPVAVTLAASGFIGRVAADIVPVEELAEVMGVLLIPEFVLLWLIPIAVSLLSLLGVSPIMLAVFFGSMFAALPILPADATLIALAISCGWSLAMMFSPFATVVIMVSLISNVRAGRLSAGWNLWFGIICSFLLLPVFWLLTGGQ